MDFSVILEQMVVLFLLMVVGYGANKLRVMDTESNAKLTRLVLNITLPALLVTSISDGAYDTGHMFYVFGLCIITYAIMGVVAFIASALIGGDPADRGTYAAMTLFGNVGYMGFPVITAIFGAETIFYGAIFNVVYNLITFTVGIRMISSGAKGGGTKFSPKMMLNAGLAASVIAIILFCFNITLPTAVNRTLGYLGDTTTPLAMLLLGSTLAEMRVRELFDQWRIYVITLVKLVVVPLAVYFIMGLIVSDQVLLGVIVVLAGTPMASAITMISIRYGGNQKLVSKGIFISTLLSVVTIPALVYFLF